MSDIIIQKKNSIERCIKQARKYYAMPSEQDFSEDQKKQDLVTLNLQRACEQCIDLANHFIRLKKLGTPATSPEAFILLRKEGIIDSKMEQKLITMVEFRDILVHHHEDIDYAYVEEIVKKHADNLIDFSTILFNQL